MSYILYQDVEILRVNPFYLQYISGVLMFYIMSSPIPFLMGPLFFLIAPPTKANSLTHILIELLYYLAVVSSLCAMISFRCPLVIYVAW